jgi:Integral membrane protein TerC family
MEFEFLFADWLGKPAWMWLAFMGIVVALLTLDLGILHKENREIETGESLLLSAGYISLGLLFGAWVWWYLGPQSGVEYMTGFAIEKTLAMDNVFVIAMIFGYFAIPRLYQHRVLFWGILGVIVLRAIMIGIGAPIVENFAWVLYVFAVFLILTGIKMIYMGDKQPDIGSNPALLWLKRRFNVTEQLHGEKFFVQLPDPKAPAFVHGADPDRDRRRDLRGRLGARDLPDHDRSVHRLHVEYFRHLGFARTLFRAGRDGASLLLSEIRAVGSADLHRLEDLRGVGLGLGEVPAGLGARHNRRHPGHRHSVQPVEDERRRADGAHRVTGRWSG